MSENRLARETSPYLLQHKDNPVHWWAWGPEALAEAKRTGKPILLSVGYAACHWCHVMAHESFEDEATAEVMNGLYVNIKVDREERPDIDALYMGALMRFNEQGGWPLTMFLDSEARPFWGGTYFPKQTQYGRPGFVTVLMQIAATYSEEPEKVRDNAERILASLSSRPEGDAAQALTEDAVKDLIGKITRAVDREHGGLNGAPKFPQWNVFWLLWRGAMRFGDENAKQAVVTTLTHICQGGIYDHVGGGFARYSVDEYWLIPHFEKMLYDNALLIDLLTEVWRETQNPLFARRISETVGWLEREMIAEGGGFAASLDADSEGEEGKFYVWTPGEIAEVLGAEDAAFFGSVYGVTEGGNFEGHNNLNRLGSLVLLSEAHELRLSQMRCRLFGRRAGRVRPGWDDKVLADWNGLMIAALSRAALVFDKPDWLAMSERAFACVTDKMAAGDGRLWHSYRAGQAKAPATAADYANMSWAALRLHQATGRAAYLEHARAWSAILDKHYWDVTSGGYCMAADDTADVILKLSPAHDDAVPNANAIQLSNLLSLAALTGDAAYAGRADDLYNAYLSDLRRAPVGHCGLLAASFDLVSLVQIAIHERTPADTKVSRSPLNKTLFKKSIPGALEYCLAGEYAADMPVALSGKTGSAGKSTAYICSGPLCGPPVLDPDAFAESLVAARQSRKVRA
jgi:uncharacterized protein